MRLRPLNLFLFFATLIASIPYAALKKNEARVLALLENPYGDNPTSFDALPRTQSADECDALEQRTAITHEPDGNESTSTTTVLCLRRLSQPDPKKFKIAVRDAVDAMLTGNEQHLGFCFAAWPAYKRKELHDKSLAEANRQGAYRTSTMPKWDDAFQPEYESQRIRMAPFFMSEIALEKNDTVIAKVDALSSEGRFVSNV